MDIHNSIICIRWILSKNFYKKEKIINPTSDKNKNSSYLGIVIFLNPPFDEIKNRVVGRVSCPKCKATFNEEIEFLKPKKQGICDKCGSNLVKRSDDNLEAYKTRYDVYLNSTSPLIDFYKERKVLYEVDDVDIDIVTSKIINIVEGNND